MDDYLEKNFFSQKFKNIFWGVLFSYITTIIFILVLSIFLCYTNLNENIVECSLVFIAVFSVLLGSFRSLTKIREKGLVYGTIIGSAYIVLLYLISSIISNDFSIGFGSIIMIVLGIISGMLGGILGVNLKM